MTEQVSKGRSDDYVDDSLAPDRGLLPFAHWGHDDGSGWFFGPLLWLALLAAVLLLLWRGRGWFGSGGPGSRRERRESPNDLLERRFAEGGLSAEEYRRRRSVLDEPRE